MTLEELLVNMHKRHQTEQEAGNRRIHRPWCVARHLRAQHITSASAHAIYILVLCIMFLQAMERGKSKLLSGDRIEIITNTTLYAVQHR